MGSCMTGCGVGVCIVSWVWAWLVAVSELLEVLRGWGLTMKVGIQPVRLVQTVLLFKGRFDSWQWRLQ